MSNPTVAGFRLSIQQDRIWSQQNSEQWAECEFALDGPLDTAKLRQAIREVVARHEILRTVFHRQTGVKVPFQVILDSPGFAWKEAVEDPAQRTPLDVEKGPALSAVLLEVSPDNHVLGLRLPA